MVFRTSLIALVAFLSIIGLTSAQPGGSVTAGPSTATTTAASTNSPITPEQANKRLKRVTDALKTKATQDPTGHIRIIARLSAAAVATEERIPARFDRGAFDKASLDAPLARIEGAQKRLLARMKSVGVPYSKGLRHLPMTVLFLKPAEIDALIATGEVAALHEDKLTSPALEVTTRIVSARQATIMGASGKGTTIAILDTGVPRDHSFFQDRVVGDQACFSSNFLGLPSFTRYTTTCPNGLEEATGSIAGQPCRLLTNKAPCQHGTQVAGIAAGRDNAGYPQGVAANARILPIQIGTFFEGTDACPFGDPCLKAFESEEVAALQFVRENASRLNIVAANLSFADTSEHSSACDDTPMADVIAALAAVQVATVISAGNEGHDNGVADPACVSKAVTVGATDNKDALANFPSGGSTNHGSLVDILAPGVNVETSTLPSGTTAAFGGTSAAAPHIAGAIAVLREKFPNWTPDQLVGAMHGAGRQPDDPRNVPPARRLDICAVFRNFLPEAAFPAWANDPNVKVLSGDFDGDGKTDDIALVGGAGWRSIPIAYRQPDGTFTVTNEPLAHPFADFVAWAQPPNVKAVIGDFDADGKRDDIALTGGFGWTTIPVAYGQPGGAFTVTNRTVANFPTWAQQSGSKVVSGDFDGDGRIDDIALVGLDGTDAVTSGFFLGGDVAGQTTTIAVAFGQSGGDFTVTREPAGNFSRLARAPNVRALAGSFDGDRRVDDIVLVAPGWTTIPIALGQAPGKFTVSNRPLDAVSAASAASILFGADNQIAVADIDGDRQFDDLVAIGPLSGNLNTTVGMSGKFKYAFKSLTSDFKTTSRLPNFAQEKGARLVSGDFDGDGLRDDFAVVGGADWCHIPVYLGPSTSVANPNGGELEQ